MQEGAICFISAVGATGEGFISPALLILVEYLSGQALHGVDSLTDPMPMLISHSRPDSSADPPRPAALHAVKDG